MGKVKELRPSEDRYKVTTEQVLEYFKDNPDQWIPVSELAEYLDTSAVTVRKRLKLLKQDGEPLIHGSGGYLYLIEGISDEMIAEASISNARWVRGTAISLSEQAEAHKTIMKLSKNNDWFLENKDLRLQYLKLAKNIIGVMVALEIQE